MFSPPKLNIPHLVRQASKASEIAQRLGDRDCLEERDVLHVGHDRGNGNMIAVQEELSLADFLTSDGLERKLRKNMEHLNAHGLITDKSVVVFPEVIGLGLILSDLVKNEKFFSSPLIAQMYLVGRSIQENLKDIFKVFIQRRCDLNLRRVVMCERAGAMAEDYQRIFGDIAREYNCHVVAGTIPLPSPTIEEGKIKVDPKGKVFNAGFVFHPDGSVDPQITKKVFLTKEEKKVFSPGALEALPIYKTPMGRLGILICADAWFPQCYEQLRGKVDMIAVTIFGGGWDQRWDDTWRGYSGQPNPSDVDPSDPGKINEATALREYSIGRYNTLPDVHFVTCAMRAGLFGHTSFRQIGGGKLPGQTPIEETGKRAAAVVWL